MHAILPFKIMSSANTGLGWEDSGVVPSQHAVVSRSALHVNLFLSHHTRLALLAQQEPELQWVLIISMAYTCHCYMCRMWCFHFSYLVVQVPGLIVFLCAFPAIYGLVVYLDELPFRTVAEVAKKAANGGKWKKFKKNNTNTVSLNQQVYYNVWDD